MKSTNYKDLLVWQRSMSLVVDIYNIIRELPKEETFAMSDQIRRAAISVPSNIAEGHGRKGKKEFIQFLYISRGSLYELETQLLLCNEIGYLNYDKSRNSFLLIQEISKMLNSLIGYLSTTNN